MFALTSAQTAALAGGFYTVRNRVSVQDSGGTYHDLSAMFGANWISHVSFGAQLDDPVISGSIEFKREIELNTLSPLISTGQVAAITGSPLIDVGRKIKVESAIIPQDAAAGAGDWFLNVEGYIDTLDAGDGWSLSVQFRDLGAKIADTYIEQEMVYCIASGQTQGMKIWAPSTTYAVNDLLLPTNLNGFFYKATSITTGISGANEPNPWPSSGSITDGGVTWTQQGVTSVSAGVAVEAVMQAILTDNGTGITLSTPVSPGWNIKAFKQQRQNVLEAIRALAQQIGWDVRYLFNSGAGVLTFYQPQRTSPTVGYTFAPSSVINVKKLALDIAGIRNAVQVIFSNSLVLDATGNPLRQKIDIQDNTSITRYGRRFMEIAEDWTSKIDTTVEATDMATACVNDLSSPLAEQEVEILYWPFAEIGDFYTFTAGSSSRYYTSDQSLAVVAYKHELTSSGTTRTTLTTRGKPAGSYQGWHDISCTPGGNQSHGLQGMDGGVTLTMTGTPTGITMTPSFNRLKISDWAGFEYHASTTNGFTPSSSTLVATGLQGSFTIPGLDPTKTYYGTVIPIRRNPPRLVTGLPLPQVSAVPGTVNPQHILNSTSWVDQPPNADFGSWLNGSGNPPDQWSMLFGTWGTNAVRDASTVFDGAYSVNFDNTATLISNYFPVKPGTSYLFDSAVRVSGTFEAVAIQAKWYTNALALISTTTINLAQPAINTWTRQTSLNAPPSNACFCRLTFAVYTGGGGAGTKDAWVGYCRATEIKPQQPWIGMAGSYTGGNWTDVAGGWALGAYQRDLWGYVHVKGLAKANPAQAANASIFTLPAGYRPGEHHQFAVNRDIGGVNSAGGIGISSAGVITTLQAVALNDYVCLDVTFLGEQ